MIKRHQELSDEAIEQASLDEIRAAYRALREHHILETSALIHRCEASRKLMEVILDDETPRDQLVKEAARLAEIIDYMQNHYSPIGGRSCALCVYDNGRFIRRCAIHRWYEEMSQAPLQAALVNELNERRSAEAIFIELDQKFQAVAACEACQAKDIGGCEEHNDVIIKWQDALEALGDLARLHQGYVR